MPSSACIRMTIRTGYFFNVDSLLFSPFSEPVMLWSLAVAARGEIGREGCEISSVVAGPSPRLSSRGGPKTRWRGKKNRRGAHFKNTVLDVCSNRRAKCEIGGAPISNGEAGHHWPPAGDEPVWLNIWNCRPGCFYNWWRFQPLEQS